MSARFFLDTNILVYARDQRHPEKQARAVQLVQDAFASGDGRLSRQVLHEFYVTVTGKLSPGLSRPAAREAVEALESLEPIALDDGIMKRAWRLEDRYSLSFWDALIVAAAAAQGCATLFSEDLQNGLEIEGLTLRNPFM